MILQDKETDALFSLLAYGLFQRELTADFGSIDWNKLVASANDHVVTALLYPGIKKVQDVPSEIFDHVQKHAVRSYARRDRIAAIQQEIIEIFSTSDILCAILKGTAIECSYPYPELRLPGDIDILISGKQMQNAADILTQAGYLFVEKNDIHTSYVKKGVHIEIHNRISRFPDNEKGQYTQRYLADAERYVTYQDLGKGVFPMLAHPYHSISLLAHMERHMCASGIGLRQLCDWAVTVHRLSKTEEDELLTVLEACGMLRYAQVLTKVCELYLQLPERRWTGDVQKDDAVSVMEDILSVGNFQAQQMERPFCSAVMDPYDLKGNGKSNMLSAYYRRVKRKMQMDFPWVKSDALTPLFCVYYPIKWGFDVLTKKRIHGNVLATIRIAKKREQLLRKMAFYK